MKKCVFAGTFDPVTNGHLEVVNKALKDFDQVVVALGVNPEKTPYFSKQTRLELLRATFGENDRVEVCAYEGLTVDFMRKKGIDTTVRGIRNSTDLAYEKIMKENNEKMYPEIDTIFYECSKETQEISSTLVREKLKKGESIKGLVPDKALEIILEKNT